jgi:periplasmic protein TonB
MSKSTFTRVSTAAALLLGMALSSSVAMAQSTNPKVVKKVPMEFPGEAARKGVDRGVLKARVTIDGAGVPTEVAILDTQPAKARVLNDSVIAALTGWRFESLGKPSTFEMQVVMTAE